MLCKSCNSYYDALFVSSSRFVYLPHILPQNFVTVYMSSITRDIMSEKSYYKESWCFSMKSKTLILSDSIFGLIAGIILLFGIWFIAASAVGGGDSGMSGSSAFLLLLKLASIALGIVTLVLYKNTDLVKPVAPVLLIVGGGVALIPFLGWIGGIVMIVGGGIGFSNLKNFK